jgi:hypothetical protein
MISSSSLPSVNRRAIIWAAVKKPAAGSTPKISRLAMRSSGEAGTRAVNAIPTARHKTARSLPALIVAGPTCPISWS